ncbi:MAG: YbaB/EbfC family nucleoid-associated protein [Planctomycetota bacterium]
MDFGQLFKQAQDMQRKLERIESELKDRVVEGTASGGLVKVYVSGTLQVKGIEIDKEAVDPEDVEALEDLVLVAVRDAVKQAQEMAEESKKAVTGGLAGPLGGLL